MSIQVSRLPSGLTVATDRMDAVETVSLGIWVGVGTRHEAPEINGVAHLLEHMAFKGTSRRTARDIAVEIEAVGGHLNAHTGREHTAYYAKVLKEDTPLALDIVADILQRSIYDPEEFAREREVVLQEIGQAEDTPDDIIFDHFQATAFPDQSLGRPVLGSEEIVSSLPREGLIDFKQRHYGAGRMVLAASGKIDHASLVEMADRAFAELPSRSDSATDPARYAGGEFRDGSDLEQVHLVIGFPGVAMEHPDYYALSVLSTMLGGGMSSRLFQEVREKRGLCYAVYSFFSAYHDGGLVGVYAGTGEDQVEALMPVIAAQLAGMTRPAAEEELRRARAQMKASLLMSLESPGARMEALGSQLLIFGRTIPIAEIVTRIDAVTAEQVAACATRLLSGGPTLAAIGPIEKLETLDRFAARLR